jgi:hypothetical protein
MRDDRAFILMGVFTAASFCSNTLFDRICCLFLAVAWGSIYFAGRRT